MNAGMLPRGLTALVEQAGKIVRKSAKKHYADLANRIVVKNKLGRTIAAIEIVSPGNKDSRRAFKDILQEPGDIPRRCAFTCWLSPNEALRSRFGTTKSVPLNGEVKHERRSPDDVVIAGHELIEYGNLNTPEKKTDAGK